MFVSSRMRRRQIIFTFIFFASFFKAGNLPVLELVGTLQFAAILVLLRQGSIELDVGSKGALQTKKQVTDP